MTTRSSRKERMKSSDMATQKLLDIHLSQNLDFLGEDMVGNHLGRTQERVIHASVRSPQMDGMEHGLSMGEHGFDLCGIVGSTEVVSTSQSVRRGRRYDCVFMIYIKY